MQPIIDWIVKLIVQFLPSGSKSYLGALLLGLTAFFKALAEVGIVLVPDNIINIVAMLAAALMGIGLRHAIAKGE